MQGFIQGFIQGLVHNCYYYYYYILGQLYLVNNNGHCVEVEHVYAPLSHLVYSTDTSFLAALTNDMSLIIFSTQNNSIHKYSEVCVCVCVIGFFINFLFNIIFRLRYQERALFLL